MSWKPPEGLNPELYKVFEKHWETGQYYVCGKMVDSALPSMSLHELRDRLNEWLEQY